MCRDKTGLLKAFLGGLLAGRRVLPWREWIG
jgi:hypothetical protein